MKKKYLFKGTLFTLDHGILRFYRSTDPYVYFGYFIFSNLQFCQGFWAWLRDAIFYQNKFQYSDNKDDLYDIRLNGHHQWLSMTTSQTSLDGSNGMHKLHHSISRVSHNCILDCVWPTQFETAPMMCTQMHQENISVTATDEMQLLISVKHVPYWQVGPVPSQLAPPVYMNHKLVRFEDLYNVQLVLTILYCGPSYPHMRPATNSQLVVLELRNYDYINVMHPHQS